MQSDAERAATNTIHWLQSCNAYVVLDSGGVYTTFATWPNLLHICYDSLALLMFVIICSLCPQLSAGSVPCIAVHHLHHHAWIVGSYLFVCTGAQPSSALLDCKLSTGLRMPEDLAAVAHGDATLNLDNFMHQVRV